MVACSAITTIDSRPVNGGFSCIQCGYPLGHVGDGTSPPYGACPECGSSQAHSWERWSQLGGRTAALVRLMLSSSRVASLAVALAVIESVKPWLLPVQPSASDLSGALYWGIGMVTLALGAAAWGTWRSVEQNPPFTPRARIPVIPRILLMLWCLGAVGVVVLNVAPRVLYAGGTIVTVGLGVLMMFVYLPTSVVMAALAQCALPARPFVWRWRQAPTLAIACTLILAIVTHVILSVIDRLSSTGIEGLDLLSSIVIPILLVMLAIVQLRLLRWAAATVRAPATLASVQQELWRRTWVGAVVLPLVLLSSVAYVHMFIYGLGSANRLAVSDGADVLLFLGVLCGIVVLWLAAARAPLVIVRRAIVRAMQL